MGYCLHHRNIITTFFITSTPVHLLPHTPPPLHTCRGVSLSLLSATLVGELANVPFLVGKLQRIAGEEGRGGGCSQIVKTRVVS